MPKPTFQSSRLPSSLWPKTALAKPRPPATGLLLLLISAPILAAQNLSTWQGGSGAWLDAAKWTPAGIPNTAAADVVIDGAAGSPSTVTFGYAATVNSGISGQVGRLQVNAGDRLEFTSNPSSFNMVDSAFAGAGAIQLDGTMAFPYSVNSLNGTKTLSGTGTLQLGSAGQRPEITGKTTTSVLIQGSALIGRANASNPQIVNSGIINANIPGQDIDFHGLGGVNRSVNTGTLKATVGGQMQFGQGEWLNAGATINADGTGSQVSFYRGGLIEGGLISSTNGGVLQVGGSFNGSNGGHHFRNVTVEGAMKLQDQMLLNGTLTNNGTISIPAGRIDAMVSGSYDPSETVTIAGSGQIILDKPFGTAPAGDSAFGYRRSIWRIDQQIIRGAGQVGDEDFTPPYITNRGTFQADRNGEPLRLRLAGLDNQSGGILRAQDGGILRIASGGVLANTGGTIEAKTGGRVEANFGRIEGGLVKNNGGFIDLNGLTLVNPGTGMRLEGDLALGKAGANQQAGLVGTIENKGVLHLKGTTGQALVIMGEAANPNVTLNGGGELVLGDPATGQATSGFYEPVQATVLANTEHTIRGFGFMGNRNYDSGLILQNSGLVMADVAGKTLDAYLREITNQGGTLRARNSGTLSFQVRGGINNTGGIIEAEGGTVAFSGARVTNGTLSNNAGTFNLSNATLVNDGPGLTLQGSAPFTVDSNKVAGLAGSILNKGTIHLRPSNSTRATLAIGLPGTLNNSITGGGEIVMGDASLPGANDPRMRNADGAVNNVALTLDNQTLRGFGVIGYNEYEGREMLLTNNGSILADVSGRRLSLVPKTLTNSPGRVIRATGGGELYFNPVELTNTGATLRAENASKASFDGNMVLSSGTVETQSGGNMEFMRQFTAQGDVDFNNAGTALFGSGNGNVTFEGLANGGSTFTNTGTIRKTGPGDYTLRTVLNSTSGDIDVQSGTLRISGGGTVAGGTHNLAAGSALRFQNNPGYTFSGVNDFNGEGQLWLDGGTQTLANGGAELNVENLNVYNTTIAGSGTINVSEGGSVFLHPVPTFFSGVKLVTGAGSNITINKNNQPLQFSNGASWDNHGTISMGGYINVLQGSTGTLFRNLREGTFRATGAQDNRLDMKWENRGKFHMDTGSMAITTNGTFINGSATVANEHC